MDKWGNLVEERLQEAFAEGAFENLPGKGRPLELDEDPLADPHQWLARHILRNSGMSLPWVEERRQIEEAFAASTKRLARAWSAYADNSRGAQTHPFAAQRWQEAQADFRAQVATLNGRIRTYNLSVPHMRFQHALIDADCEIVRLQRKTHALD